MKYFFLLILVPFLLFCERQQEKVPNYYVDFYISLDWPAYSALNAVGNYVFVGNENIIGDNQAPLGIVLYRLSDSKFKAYDRTCSYKPSAGCSVEIASDMSFVKCACCNSQFFLVNGDPTSGSAATLPLREYNTHFEGRQIYVSSYGARY